MGIHLTSTIFKEGRMFVAHTPELDVPSCGTTREKALKNLKEAVRLMGSSPKSVIAVEAL